MNNSGLKEQATVFQDAQVIIGAFLSSLVLLFLRLHALQAVMEPVSPTSYLLLAPPLSLNFL